MIELSMQPRLASNAIASPPPPQSPEFWHYFKGCAAMHHPAWLPLSTPPVSCTTPTLTQHLPFFHITQAGFRQEEEEDRQDSKDS